MSMPREDSTPHSRDPTPRNVAGQDQTSDQEFSVPLEEGLHFISLLESALRVGTGVPENAPVGVVTPTSDVRACLQQPSPVMITSGWTAGCW
jgi:hypothetical protein